MPQYVTCEVDLSFSLFLLKRMRFKIELDEALNVEVEKFPLIYTDHPAPEVDGVICFSVYIVLY